jgi:hypothetical protein
MNKKMEVSVSYAESEGDCMSQRNEMPLSQR